MKRDVSIIGCGRRVMQDVIPVLLSAGVNKNQITVFARSARKLVVRDYVLNVQKLPNKLPYTSLIYICLPTSQVVKFLVDHKDEISGKDVLIDTPFLFDNIHLKNTKQTSVCEDVIPFLKKFSINTKLKKGFNFIFFQKSFFEYHGVAFVETILGKIFFMINFSRIKIFIAQKGVALSVGLKNYEEGNIHINGLQLPIPELSNEEIKLIGGLTDMSTFSSRFLDLKRIGLRSVITKYFETGLLDCCSIESGSLHSYISSKKIYISLK